MRCGQQDDYSTDLEYFIAANKQKNRRVAAVLIRRNDDLEACVLFIEHCRYGIGLGLWRGGDTVGDGLIAGSGRTPGAICVSGDEGRTEAMACIRRELRDQDILGTLSRGDGAQQ